MKIQIVETAGAEQPWHVRVRADNGRILMHSEGYVTERAAFRCAELIRAGTAAATLEYVKRVTNSGDDF